MGTRYVHRVRCKKPTDDTIYVDVEVTDAIGFIGENGQEVVFDFSKKATPIPYIIDEVGASCGKGNLNTCTRVSHMEQIISPDDNSQTIFIEVLDILSFVGPFGYEPTERIHKMPSTASAMFVKDIAGIGVTGVGENVATRIGHTIRIQSKTSPNEKDFIGVVTTDTIGFTRFNGEQLIQNASTYDVIDTTAYTSDSDGNTVPPDNTDPNVYVKFPVGSMGPWVKTGEDGKGVSQGLLWRIVGTDANSGPWWIWTPQYQPYEWSSQTHNGHIGGDYHAERCFPYCTAPYTCGCETFLTDYYPPVPPGNWHRLPNVGVSSTDPSPVGGAPIATQGFLTINDAADYASHTDPGACVKMVFTNPPTERITLTSGYTSWQPSLWQLVGMTDEQPFHLDPITHDKVYDPPNANLARKVANEFSRMWNATSDAYNAGEINMDGSPGPVFDVQWRAGDGRPFDVAINEEYPSAPEDWAWAVPIVDGPTTDAKTIGRWDTITNQFDFAGGLPPAGWAGGHTIINGGDYGYRLWIFHPAFATPIMVSQLDPKIWDTSGDVPRRWA